MEKVPKNVVIMINNAIFKKFNAIFYKAKLMPKKKKNP